MTASFGLSLFKPILEEAISAAAEGSPARGLGLAMSAIFVVQALLPFLSEGIRALLGARGVFICFGWRPASCWRRAAGSPCRRAGPPNAQSEWVRSGWGKPSAAQGPAALPPCDRHSARIALGSPSRPAGTSLRQLLSS